MSRAMLRSIEGQPKLQRILVTGGAGFIGSHLASALVNRGYEVTILDNLSFGTLKNITLHLSSGQVRFVRCDVRNMQDVKETLDDFDIVFHLAAITSVSYSIENPTTTNEVNGKGTRNLLEASLSSNVKRFINISSSAVYGNPRYLPIDEIHPVNPMSPYAKSKVKGEEYCAEFKEKYGLETLTLRLFNVYGSRQSTNQYSGVIAKFIEHIRRGKQPVIYGDGKQTRDFVHVSDVVQALLSSMNSNNAVGETFNIGSGKPITINELCQIVMRKLNAEMKPVHEKPKYVDIKNSCAKIEKARKFLGYNPKINLEEGLEDLVNHWM
nr:SDR family NAD(P)-dependent oxidoreductase [Candidatus Njordarchaeota archaeon]